ncbi:MAG: MurR/RpiR family transcriptional regulator [Solobacterium sp.]|nr:MurR/RpiR family transcriptional regulator [Solobacterium sp.]
MSEGSENRYSAVRFNPQTSLLAILNRNDEKDISYILAKYLLEHFSSVPDMSIYQIADDCYTSRSSVQRFFKTIGYDSYTAFKEDVSEVKQHQKSFITYTDHTDFAEYIMTSVEDMMNDISTMADRQKISRIAERIHDCDNFVIVNAEDSSSSARIFQQHMLSMGRLVQLVTSANSTEEKLSRLTDRDFMMTCSVSGNYAIAINDEIKDVKAYRALVTLNHTALYEDNYDTIFYLSEKLRTSDRTIRKMRNVYTRYGMSYFFDLLFHSYFVQYQNEIPDSQ